MFAFDQSPVLHPQTAEDLPFFGLRGTLNEAPTGVRYAAQIDPEIKVLLLGLTDVTNHTGTHSRVDILDKIETWSLGADFMLQLSRASTMMRTALSIQASATDVTPLSPVSTCRMPVSVDWGTGVPAPAGAGF